MKLIILVLKAVLLFGIFVNANSKYDSRNVHRPSLSITLTHVDGNSKWNKIPTVYAEKNKKILLACKANVYSKIIWKHNKRNLDLPPPYEIPWDKGGILLIYLIPGRTDGVYECIAKSRFSSEVVVKKVRVIIKEEHELPAGFPKIITHPSNINTFRRQVDFHCVVSGESPIQIIWYKDRRPVISDENHQTSISMVGQHFSSNLMINNVSDDDKGFYQCVAINSYGQAVSRQANINCQIRRSKRDRRNAKSGVVDVATLEEDSGLIPGDTLSSNSSSIDLLVGGGGDLSGILGITDKTTKEEPDCYANGPNVNFTGKLQVEHYCTKSGGLGEYMQITWKAGSRNLTMTGFVIIISYHTNKTKENRICHTLGADRRSFIFGEKDGFSRYNQYSYLVAPRPIPSGHRSTLTEVNMKECINQIDGITTTTSKPITEPSTKDDDDDDQSNSNNTVILVCTAGGLIGLALFVLLFVIKRKQNSSSRHLTFQADVNTSSNRIYISYCGVHQEDQIKVQRLASNLNLENVTLKVDFLCETRITDAGGFPFWMNQEMELADRIIVFVTLDYIKAITTENNNEESHFDQQIIKVRNEYRTIVERDYFSASTNERTKVLFILDRSVKEQELPVCFKNRISYSYPREFSANNEDFQKILGRLFNFERMVLQNNNVRVVQERRRYFGCI